MGKITDITKQRNGKRANIFVDGNYVCGLELITVAGARLKVGDETDSDKLAQLQLLSESEKAFSKAIDYLSVRRRTQREIMRKLKEKGYLPEVIEKVVEKLKEYGYIDDVKFCEQYIETYIDKNGVMKIKSDLLRLGVESSLINEALKQADEDAQSQAAVDAARKYLRGHDYDRLKLMRHLANRGFGYADSKAAAQAVKDEIEDEE